MAALVCISETCETIKTLGLYNCIFGEIFGILPVLTAHHENQIHNDPTSPPLKVSPFLDLERLAIVSECSTKVKIHLCSLYEIILSFIKTD